MFRQYAEHKKKHKDAVLFFRMGDFYEMFKSDAVEVSRLLNLTLTQRQGVPMCGIPYHAAGNYIARLLKLGKKIAICEQIQLPENGKGLAEREVIEIVTPGTVIEDNYLEEHSNNYLAAFAGSVKQPAFVYIDLSTGEFQATVFDGENPKDALRRELARTNPREMIIQESLLETDEYSFLRSSGIVLDRVPDWFFNESGARDILLNQFGTLNLKAFGIDDKPSAVSAAGAVLDYIEDKHKGLLPHIKNIVFYSQNDSVGLDESTIRNLELVRNLHDGGTSFTLLDTLDQTKTAAGARLLKKRLLRPFPAVEQASSKHEKVEYLYHNQNILSRLREILSGVLDIERLSARTAMDKAHAKDLLAIRNSINKAVLIREIINDDLINDNKGSLDDLFEELSGLAFYLNNSIMEDPSILLTEGRLIKEGFDSELDRMRSIRSDGKSFLDEYVSEERAATGISSLKLKYNRILGYFFEVPKSQQDKLPERFRRRQSLTQSERFSTDRLDQLETEITSVAEKIVEREKILFLEIRENVKKHLDSLMRAAAILADLDVVQSFAHAATEYGYIRPELSDNISTEIINGRHPVVEKYLMPEEFVPNSIKLSADSKTFALVTGPNMAGKSTVLRQVALITLMAQAGSFVPAESARIGIADKIFCRVGASDNLARGESTFLVEMNETANILRNATPRSLVIMDEVGRGTGTADGLAIAKAVSEYLLEHSRPRTMFATHYRELVNIEHPRLINLSMSVEDTGNRIIFTRKLVEGPAKASYGIHVASLAGLPEEVINRAAEILESIESTDISPESLNVKSKSMVSSAMLFNPEDLILDHIRELDVNSITPLEAINLINEWKKDLKLSEN